MSYQTELSGNLCRVHFSISMWAAKVKDKALSAEVEENKKAERGTVRSWRHLVKKEIAPIHSLGGAIRNSIYSVSYPMGLLSGIEKDQGRVIPVKVYDKHKAEWTKMIRRWVSMVQDFCEDNLFDLAIQRDAVNQGENFNRGDYPATVEQLQEKFAIDFKVGMFSASQTLLFDIMDKAIEDVEKATEEKAQELTETLVKDNFDRIRKPLKELIKGMQNHGIGRSYFKDVTIENVSTMVDLMDGFNFTNDPRITDIIEDIKRAGLTELDPKVLRPVNDGGDRAMVAGNAERIVEKLDSYF